METIRIPASDPRVLLSRNSFTPVEGQGMRGRAGGVMNVIFRGISARVLGYPPSSTNTTATMRFTMMDTDERKQSSNSTSTGNGQTPSVLVSYTGLEDSDHELEASMSSDFTIAFIEIDYLPASGFTPSVSGSNATEVDPRAIIINSGRPEISYLGNQWTIQTDDAMLERDMYNCRERGRCSWEYSFEGTAIWWFTSLTDEGGVASVAVDGVLEPTKVSLTGAPLHQRLVWSKTDLPFGRHTVTAALDSSSEDGAPISLDFLRILTDLPSSSSAVPSNTFVGPGPSGIPSSSPSKDNQPSSVPVGAIAGAVIGTVTLVLLIVVAVLIWLRRRKQRRELEAQTSNPVDEIQAFPRLIINAEGGFGPQTESFRAEKSTLTSATTASNQPNILLGRSGTVSTTTITTPQSPQDASITGLGLIPGPSRQLPATPWTQSDSLSYYTETPPPRYEQI